MTGRWLTYRETLLHFVRGPARREFVTLLLLLLLAGACWAFALIADEVSEQELGGFDRAVLLALRQPNNPAAPLGPRWFAAMMRDVSALGSAAVLVFLTLAVAGYLFLERKSHSALLLLVAVTSGQLLMMLLKLAFGRERPTIVPHGLYTSGASFPSGHAMSSAITYLTLAALLVRVEAQPRTRVYVLLLAFFVVIAVGVSRVYLGVHWPSDVLAGWTAGVAWAILWWLIARWLQWRHKVELPERELPDGSLAP